MRKLIALLAGCAMAAGATLKPGDEVKTDAIAAAKFLKGEAPKEWEKDKLYVLECWATWCGPCVKVIPHVNELHKKYAEKGLRVIGMNVWEKEQAKVEEFVTKKGDGMAYPVAFVNESAFSESWLKAAGADGIPYAFVVKNGKLLFTTHPASLEDSVIEDLLAGGEKEAKIVKSYQEKAAAEAAEQEEQEKKSAEQKGRMGTFPDEINKLGNARDFDGMIKLSEKTLKENAKLTKEDKQQINMLMAQLYMELKKYDDAEKAIDSAVAVDPESDMAKNADRFKKMIENEKKKGAADKETGAGDAE